MITRRSIKNFSVTQVKTFRDCPRQWYDRWILGKKTEKSIGQARGDGFHTSVENFLRFGKTPPPEHALYLQKLEPFFHPNSEDVLVEHWMRMKTQFGPDMVGKIDYVRYQLTPPRLVDWKTTSDPRWILTPAEVEEDIQTNTYGHYLFSEGISDGEMLGGLINIVMPKTPPKTLKGVKVVPQLVMLTKEKCERVWDELQPDLERMMETAEIEDRNDVQANTSACPKFGGCPFRSDCGFGALAGIRTRPTKTKENTVSFRDRLKGGNGQSGPAKEETPPPVAAAPVAAPAKSGGFADRMRKNAAAAPAAAKIVPPDAPARTAGGADPMPKEDTTEVAAIAADAAGQDVGDVEIGKKRGRPKGAKDSAPRSSAAKDGMALFINAWPAKGFGDGEPVLFDDWIATTMFELNEWVAKEKKVDHVMLLPFGEQKALVEQAVQDKLSKGNLPSKMVVWLGSQAARDVLPFLIPHATQITRGRD